MATDPSYTVNVWFESNWNGVQAEQLLVTDSATRAAFEFQELLSPFNPFRYPSTSDGFELTYYLPPEVALPEDVVDGFKALALHQGVNTHLAAQDILTDQTQASESGLDFSPLKKWARGQLYARTFTLSDLSPALWLLGTLAIDAPEDNLEGDDAVSYFYFPVLKTALDVNRHLEVRNGVIGSWSPDIEPTNTDEEGNTVPLPEGVDRDIKLYRV